MERNVDNTNAQKNNTTNDGDVQYEYGRKNLTEKIKLFIMNLIQSLCNGQTAQTLNKVK